MSPTDGGQPLAGRKVIHLTTVDMSLEYLLLPQMLAAKAAGAEVIGVSAPGPSVPRLEAAGIRHIALDGSTRGMSIRGDLQAARLLWRIIRQEKPDVLHTHNPKPGVYGRIVGRLAGVPLVVNTVHGLYATEDDRLTKRAIVYALEGIASRFSHAELIQNEEDLALMRRLHLVPRKRLHLLGNGVDLERFSPDAVSPERRAQIRADLGIADDQVALGIVARLVNEKGYRELIEALEQLDDPPPVIAIGGHEPEKADSLSQAWVDRGTAVGIHFLGHIEDPRDHYAAMDVVVLPSYREGVPRSLMEGAAMGKPLIATDVRGCRQVVEHGVNGWLVPPKDAAKLAAAIAEAIAPRRSTVMPEASNRALAKRRFNEADPTTIVTRTYVDRSTT